MLGFSKLLFLVVVIAVVWFGFKWLGQGGKTQVREDAPRRRTRRADRAAVSAEDTVECPVCKTYVLARDPRNCGRAGCPYPGGS